MKIALLHSHFDKGYLESVKAEMIELGEPTIKAIWFECYGFWGALEGSHRVRAAKELRMSVNIEEVDYESVSQLDVTDPSLGLDIDMRGTTIEDLFADMRGREIITFD